MSKRLGLVVAPMLGVVAFVFLLALPSWTAAQPASAADAQPGAAVFDASEVNQGGLILSEDFEDPTFPPPDWQLITSTKSAIYTWRSIFGPSYPSRDERAAGVLGDPSGNRQSEVLLSPPFEVSGDRVELTFWATVRDQTKFENFSDVRLWAVLGDWDAGNTDDELLDPGDLGLEPPGNSIWTELNYPLAPYVGQTIRVAWWYSGTFGGDFFLDDVLIEQSLPEFAPPHSHVVAPYKVEPGQAMTYVLVLSNTGQLTGTDSIVRDVLPTGLVNHTAGTAQVGFVGGVVSDAFTDTPGLVAWSGTIPTATAVVISIPVQVIGSPGALISNSVTVNGPEMAAAATLAAGTRIYAQDTLVYYESFNQGPGDRWQGDGQWEWGLPVQPPLMAHSWPGVWGTVLNDDYQEAQTYLLTGTLDLTTLPPTRTVFLQWWDWFDGDEIGASDTASVTVDGDVVYQIDLDQTAWTEHLVDITSYAGQEIEVLFEFATAGVNSVGAGWYIDDVAVHARCVAVNKLNFDWDYDPLPGQTFPQVGQTISFTADYSPTAATRPIDLAWDWGDGSPDGAGDRTTHVFDSADVHEVTLSASNCAGSLAYTEPITVLGSTAYSVQLDVEGGNPVKGGEPGDLVLHKVWVRNVGNRRDQYRVEKFGGTWTTTLFPARTDPLDPLGRDDVFVGVRVPPWALPGQGDSVTVIVTSEAKPDVTERIVLTTVNTEVKSLVFLPLIIR